MITCPSCGFESPDDVAYCARCGAALAASVDAADLVKEITTLMRRVSRLEEQSSDGDKRTAELQEVVNCNADRLNELIELRDSSNLFSDKFGTRAWTIWGHAAIVSLGISIIGWMIAAIVSSN